MLNYQKSTSDANLLFISVNFNHRRVCRVTVPFFQCVHLPLCSSLILLAPAEWQMKDFWSISYSLPSTNRWRTKSKDNTICCWLLLGVSVSVSLPLSNSLQTSISSLFAVSFSIFALPLCKHFFFTTCVIVTVCVCVCLKCVFLGYFSTENSQQIRG